MKITMNKDLTPDYRRDEVKEQMSAFKYCYTDGDLIRMFEEATDNYFTYDEIVYARLEAFWGGNEETQENHYCVDMLLDCWDEFVKIRFYISQSGVVNTDCLKRIDNFGRWYDTDEKMFSVKTFRQI